MTPSGSKRKRALLVREEDLLVVDGLLGEKLARVPREVAERVGGGHDVHGTRLADGLALLGRDEPRDVVVRAGRTSSSRRARCLCRSADGRLRPGEERLPRRRRRPRRSRAGPARTTSANGSPVAGFTAANVRARLHVLPVDDRRVREGKRRSSNHRSARDLVLLRAPEGDELLDVVRERRARDAEAREVRRGLRRVVAGRDGRSSRASGRASRTTSGSAAA